MERTVPSATSEEIQLFRSTIYSLLRSTTVVQIRTLEEMHAGMKSLLHSGARNLNPDISAFIYSTLRLPDCMPSVRSVILGQNAQVFRRNGFPDIESWQHVTARARRRHYLFDGKSTLACYIASRSDIEDVIPTLTAYQIEWNKMHLLLQSWPSELDLENIEQDPQAAERLSQTINLPLDDLDRLRIIWKDAFLPTIKEIRRARRSMGIRLLSGSLSQYMRATHNWWENIERCCPDVTERPLYFVSSNPHSLVNLLTGFPLKFETELVDFVEQSNDPELRTEWQYIQSQQVPSSRENFLYYVMKNTSKPARVMLY